jgi:hypothetical protein
VALAGGGQVDSGAPAAAIRSPASRPLALPPLLADPLVKCEAAKQLGAAAHRLSSNLKVMDASGAEVSEGKTQVNDNTMRINLRPLNAGIYKVNWRAVSTDTHKIEGSFTFRVDGQ